MLCVVSVLISLMMYGKTRLLSFASKLEQSIGRVGEVSSGYAKPISVMVLIF